MLSLISMCGLHRLIWVDTLLYTYAISPVFSEQGLNKCAALLYRYSINQLLKLYSEKGVLKNKRHELQSILDIKTDVYCTITYKD